MSGTPLVSTAQMVNLDGRWYGKDTIDKMKEAADNATKSDVTAPAPEAPPAKG